MQATATGLSARDTDLQADTLPVLVGFIGKNRLVGHDPKWKLRTAHRRGYIVQTCQICVVASQGKPQRQGFCCITSSTGRMQRFKSETEERAWQASYQDLPLQMPAVQKPTHYFGANL
eukprot:1154090-Pelagomonas_calceolata.AAC.4